MLSRCHLQEFPEHTHTPQTPTRTELAHSTRTKRTDPCMYGGAGIAIGVKAYRYDHLYYYLRITMYMYRYE